jgi:hypothetical protein
MESNVKSPTETLRLKVIKRVIVLIFGCLLTSVFAAVLPLLYLVTVRAEGTVGDTPPPPPSIPIGAYIPPVVLLALVIALAYGLYDAIQLFLQYRKSKQMDEVMFP